MDIDSQDERYTTDGSEDSSVYEPTNQEPGQHPDENNPAQPSPQADDLEKDLQAFRSYAYLEGVRGAAYNTLIPFVTQINQQQQEHYDPRLEGFRLGLVHTVIFLDQALSLVQPRPLYPENLDEDLGEIWENAYREGAVGVLSTVLAAINHQIHQRLHRSQDEEDSDMADDCEYEDCTSTSPSATGSGEDLDSDDGESGNESDA